MKRAALFPRILLPVILLISIFAGWQYIEDSINVVRRKENMTSLEFFIPSPRTIAAATIEKWQEILDNTFQTLQKAIAGFTIGLILALSMAILLLVVTDLRSIVLPFAFAVNSFPVVGLAPVIVLAFGQGSFLSITAISAIICYFPVFLTLDTAFHSKNQEYLDLIHIYNADRFQALWFVQLPLAIPSLFVALKLAAPASIIGATIAEWMGAPKGIGQLVTVALYQLKPGLLYACLLEVALISAMTVWLITRIEFLLFPWIRRPT